MPSRGWTTSTPALTFQARLFELTTGERLELDWSKLLPLGRYAELLDPELAGDAYGNALEWACAEHLLGARPNRSLNPFVSDGFAPMPIELMTLAPLSPKLRARPLHSGSPLTRDRARHPRPAVG